MAAYATVPPDDPFAASRAMFAGLAGELAGPAAAGLTACELEELIDEESRKAVLQLLQDHYDLRALREGQRARALRAATAKAAAKLGKMRTRLTAGEKPNRKRMAALVTVYDAEPAPRRPHDVIAPPGGRHGARPLRPGPKALAKWLAGSVRKDPADMIAAAFDEAGAAGLERSRRSGADACVRYLGNKRELLRYDQALNAGWPIATGVIEGACRHLTADRLNTTGARWGLDGAEAVLTLRAVISNGDLEEYWQFHLKREHQRLYPGIKQGQYALGA